VIKHVLPLALAAASTLARCSVSGRNATGEPAMAGMGMGGGMATRHSAPIPPKYAGLISPVASDDASLARGAEVFTTNCATCHGDGGMGDGLAGASLDPRPAPVARSSQMMGDAYLFWRISEGGVPFDTAMPVWKNTLDETQRWDVINYVRALGRGDVQPASGVGGAAPSDQAEAQHMDQMLAQAVDQGLITQDESETFKAVHAAIQEYRTAHPPEPGSGSPAEVEAATLAELQRAGTITTEQAETFRTVHDRLNEAGLMR
jgi:mono/diheme cytochrome c family protein